jgi:hypothetical protein
LPFRASAHLGSASMVRRGESVRENSGTICSKLLGYYMQ